MNTEKTEYAAPCMTLLHLAGGYAPLASSWANGSMDENWKELGTF